MATSSEYWRKREEENLAKNLKTEAEYAKEIQQTYNYAMDQVQKEIDSFYAKYADKEGITITEAKKRASKLDMEEYSRKAKKYVEEKNFSKQANEEMRIYNLTMKVNRLELLKANIGLELVGTFDELQRFYEQALTDRTLSEFERQAGILGASVPEDVANMADTIVNASFHNATYSQRIWAHQDLLKNELGRLLTTGMVQGKNPKVLARELRKTFQSSVYNSERLMRTELARVQTAAQMQSYKNNEFTEYEYMACHNHDVCEICKALDGKTFKVEKAAPGENAPPMHPCCHCATTANMDFEAYEKWLDGYSEHGLSFKEWLLRQLTEDEETALRRYISSDAYRINDKLRNDIELTLEDEWLIKNLDSALEKMPSYSGNLLRSLDFVDAKSKDEFLQRHEIGATITYSEFLSTTKGDVYNPNADIQIYIKNSQHGKDISAYNETEQEILYKRKNRFVVKNRVEKADVIYMLFEEE